MSLLSLSRSVSLVMVHHHMELKSYILLAVFSGTFSIFGSVQTLLTPENTWVPVGILVVAVVTSIGATIKVLNFLGEVKREFERAERQRRKIARHSGMTDDELDNE